MTSEINRCYQVLELEPGASPEQVKEAWRELVKVWHPDRFPNDAKLQRRAQERLKEINLAYEKLQEFLTSADLGQLCSLFISSMTRFANVAISGSVPTRVEKRRTAVAALA